MASNKARLDNSNSNSGTSHSHSNNNNSSSISINTAVSVPLLDASSPLLPAPVMDSDGAETGAGSGTGKGVGMGMMIGVHSEKWRRVVGLILLLMTVFLWTASNFLASTLFADDTYSKPYFVTYVNTAFFIIPFIPILAHRAYKSRYELRRSWEERLGERYVPLAGHQEAAVVGRGDGKSKSPPLVDFMRQQPEHYVDEDEDDDVVIEHMQASQVLSTRSGKSARHVCLAPLTMRETARLSLEFCILWFLANYFVAACLEYTTVASSTILTSTSSVFTLLFGTLFRVEIFTIKKFLGVMASLAGIVLISTVDLSGAGDDNRGDFPHKTPREIAIGDGMALISAVMYGIYAVFMKSRIGDERRINMPLFFGMVGSFNVLLLWPGFIILHYTGVEKFEMPPNSWVLTIILVNSLSSLVSDMAWAYAVLLTSPIVVTVGLSTTIPLSLIGQILLNSQHASTMYWLGACVVLLSFVFVNHEEAKDEAVLHHMLEEEEEDEEEEMGGGRDLLLELGREGERERDRERNGEGALAP